jgi:FHS family Na+ dependent glucose MFS transporter 1
MSQEAVVHPEPDGKLLQTTAYYISMVTLGISVSALGPGLLDFAENTGTQLGEVSLLFVAFPLGRLAGLFIGGHAYDRVRGHPVMALALVLGAAALALIPVMPALALLALVVFLLGVSGGVLSVGANTLLMWVHHHRVGPFMNGMHVCYGLGALLSPLVIAQFVSLTGDIVLGYRVLALLMLPALIFLLSLPSPVNRPVEVTKDVAAVNMRLVFWVALFFFFLNGAEFAFGWWIYAYAVALDLGTVTSAAYLTSLFFGSMALGRMLAAGLLTRFPPRFILWGSLLGCLVSVVAIFSGVGSPFAIWPGTLGVGMFIGPLFPTILAFVERRTVITARVTSLFLVGVSAGSMTLPWLVGQASELAGPRVIMFIIAVAIVLAAGVFAVLMRAGSPAEQTGLEGVS